MGPLPGPLLALLTFSVALAAFMQILDTTIANVSIPTIAGDLAVSPAQGTWVITSFGVSNAITLPITGWLARRFGEVRLFAWATVMFALTSLLCGLAPNFELLVAARVLQGAAGGPMMPLSQSLLLANYPEDKKGLALAFWAMTATIAPIAGPLLGGWLTDNMGWPWIFYMNVPVGILCAVLTTRLLKGRETQRIKLPIDTIGLCLIVIGVGSLQIMLDQGNELDWFESPQIIAFGITALVAISFLLVWELTAKHPVVDLRLFARRNFTVGTLSISLGYMTFLGGVVVFPLWLQTQMGYTATWAGMASAPIGIMMMFLSPVVGKNIHRLNLRVTVSLSFLIFALTFLWQSSFTTEHDFLSVAMPRFVQGIALSGFFIPLTGILLSGIPPTQIASATGLYNFTRVLAGSFGTSISVTLWERRTDLHHSQFAEQITTANPAVGSVLDTLGHLSGPSQLEAINHMVTRQAVTLATDEMFLLAGFICALLMTLVWLARPPFGGGARAAHSD